MLRAIEYFAKSLKVTQDHWNGTIRKLEYAVRFPIRIPLQPLNHGRIFSRFDATHACDRHHTTA